MWTQALEKLCRHRKKDSFKIWLPYNYCQPIAKSGSIQVTLTFFSSCSGYTTGLFGLPKQSLLGHSPHCFTRPAIWLSEKKIPINKSYYCNTYVYSVFPYFFLTSLGGSGERLSKKHDPNDVATVQFFQMDPRLVLKLEINFAQQKKGSNQKIVWI